jgi:FKBP-type peptidyl-prolyl cis-trans isomerase
VNILAPEFRADPHPRYAELRRDTPVVQVEPAGFWAISRYEDVAFVIKNHQLFSSQGFKAAWQPEWVGYNPIANSMLQNRKKKRDADSAKFSKTGQDFLAKNKAEKGVITTASGLQYQVLTPATGAKPGPTSRVVFDYKATVAGGAEFDSSVSRGKPATLGVSDGIKGWTEAFQLMPVGSTYRFAVPPQLAYGAQGMPGKVPPNATVVYEITLRDITK